MRELRALKSFQSLEWSRWANGGGATKEIVSFDESRSLTPNGPRWRVSVARLSGTGPFSALPGVARTFVPLGSDLVLRVDGVEHAVHDGTAFAFSGDSSTALTALDRPCTAVNLMVEGDTDARVRLRTSASPAPPASQAIAWLALSAAPGVGVFDLFAAGTEHLSPPAMERIVIARTGDE
jgi:environmental stress-induced protein Ves